MARLFLTTSWDDGFPSDLRLADLLSRHGVGATFYVPVRNCENRPVLEPAELKSMDGPFEIGGHTLDHRNLRDLSAAEARRQVFDGKAALEDLLGHEVRGFCYPRGGFSSGLCDLTREAGFDYARTTENFFAAPGDDVFRLPTTLQFYPHTSNVYYRNYVKNGAYLVRLKGFLAALGEEKLVDRVLALAGLSRRNGGYLHIWGHSWELDELDLWDELEDAFRRLRGAFDSFETGSNGDFVKARFRAVAP